MKKTIAALLVGTMALGLAACGSSSSDTAASAEASTEAAAEETTEAAEEASTEAAEETTEAAADAIDLSGSKYLSDGELTVGLNATFLRLSM